MSFLPPTPVPILRGKKHCSPWDIGHGAHPSVCSAQSLNSCGLLGWSFARMREDSVWNSPMRYRLLSMLVCVHMCLCRLKEISVCVSVSLLMTNPVMLNPAVTNNRELWSGTQLNVRHVRKWVLLMRYINIGPSTYFSSPLCRKDLSDYLPQGVVPPSSKKRRSNLVSPSWKCNHSVCVSRVLCIFLEHSRNPISHTSQAT